MLPIPLLAHCRDPILTPISSSQLQSERVSHSHILSPQEGHYNQLVCEAEGGQGPLNVPLSPFLKAGSSQIHLPPPPPRHPESQVQLRA